MILEPWEAENFEMLRRSLEHGIERAIQTHNSELLDFCSHCLNLLELNNGSVTQLTE